MCRIAVSCQLRRVRSKHGRTDVWESLACFCLEAELLLDESVVMHELRFVKYMEYAHSAAV